MLIIQAQTLLSSIWVFILYEEPWHPLTASRQISFFYKMHSIYNICPAACGQIQVHFRGLFDRNRTYSTSSPFGLMSPHNLTAEGFSLACEEQNEKHLSRSHRPLSRGSWVIRTLCRRAPRLLCASEKEFFKRLSCSSESEAWFSICLLCLHYEAEGCKSMFAWCKYSSEVQYLRFVVKFSFINSLTRVACALIRLRKV